jgi:hypothetical protein
MATALNHKRYLYRISAYRVKRIALTELSVYNEIGYFQFLKDWDEFLSLSISGIRDDLTEETCNELLKIRDKAEEVFLNHIFFFTINPEDHNSEIYFSDLSKLVNEQHALLIDYYMESDIKCEADISERIIAINTAQFTLNKSSLKGKFPVIKEYVDSSIEFLKNKINYPANPQPVESIKPQYKRFEDLFEDGYSKPENINTFVRILKDVEPPLIGPDNEWVLNNGKAKAAAAAYFYYDEMRKLDIIKKNIPDSTIGKIFSKYFRGLTSYSITNQSITKEVLQLYGDNTGINSIHDRIKRAKKKIDYERTS